MFKDAHSKYKKIDRKLFILEKGIQVLPPKEQKTPPKVKNVSKVEEYVKKLPEIGQEEMLKRLLELREERKLAKNSE